MTWTRADRFNADRLTASTEGLIANLRTFEVAIPQPSESQASPRPYRYHRTSEKTLG
ncbi:hypothetical protein [Oligoflexus tunisiensis]|uniref:hypothetical protein n=1 Tax=Oligoflexus tunisiensis TaxID=708132 RepID=UPI001C4089CF|nr:hypothetical protein [Oligoflexus tunisiensis]